MDNNQSTTPTDPNTQLPPQPQAPAAAAPGMPQAPAAPQMTPPPAQPQVQTAPPSGGSKKIWIIVGAFIVVALLVGAGIMMYMQVSQNNPDLQQNPTSGISDAVKSLSTEFEQIKIDDVSADFQELDADLSSL